MERNKALWLLSPSGKFDIRTAPVPRPKAGEVVIRVKSVAVNPVDAIAGPLRRLVTPWVKYPTVIGSDIAGDVTQVGEGVTSLRPGDRVLGYAAGQEKARNSPAEGGFQLYVTVLERVCTKIPEQVTYEEAAVLPLGLATAAAGLYEPDQLALPYPKEHPTVRSEVVLVWGASTSVGCNAVQLARASGYDVIATAGSKNHDFVKGLGADAVYDYRDTDVDRKIIDAVGTRPLAGTIAIGKGSLTHALRITKLANGSKRIASVYPDPVTKTRALAARTQGIKVSTIWGGTPVLSAVGPAVFGNFLPTALRSGQFRAAPDPEVIGTGLDAIPSAIDKLRGGVSASKIVVSIE